MIVGRSLTGLETGVDYADLSIAAAMSHEHRKTLFALRSAAFASGLAIGPVIGWVCIEMHMQTAPFLVMIAYAGLLALLMPWFVPRDLPICGAPVHDRVESAGVKEPRGDLRKYFVFTAVLLSDFLRKA